jgi:flagellar protein FliO/FliZ
MTPLGSLILETMITLLGICVLAIVVLYGARRAGMGRWVGPVELVGRLPLDGRRTIYLVRVGKTVFVVGGSEAGLQKLGELSSEGLDFSSARTPSRSFRDALAQALGRQQAGVVRSDDAAP